MHVTRRARASTAALRIPKPALADPALGADHATLPDRTLDPDDWQRFLNSQAKLQAAAAAPAREPESAAPAAAEPAAKSPSPAPEYRSTGVTAFPAPPPALHKSESAPSPARPERVVITSDQLVAAVHGKLQQAAEKAVHDKPGPHLQTVDPHQRRRVDARGALRGNPGGRVKRIRVFRNGPEHASTSH